MPPVANRSKVRLISLAARIVRTLFQIELYGGPGSAINKPGRTDTAFVHRSSLLTLQLYASSSNCEVTEIFWMLIQHRRSPRL